MFTDMSSWLRMKQMAETTNATPSEKTADTYRTGTLRRIARRRVRLVQ